MTSKAPSIILHSASRDHSLDSYSHLPKLNNKAHKLPTNSCDTSLNQIDSVRVITTNRTNALNSQFGTPKSRLAKKGNSKSISISKPKMIETDVGKMIPVKVPSLINSKTTTNKKTLNLSDLMVDIYKNPTEKVDLFTRSFVSFKSIAQMQAQQLGTQSELDEAFLPSHQSSNWKNQLEFNKKQEATFRKTIQEIFVESRQNFFKLVKDKEKRTSKMPPVRIGASLGFANTEHAVLQYMNPRLQPKPLDKSKTKTRFTEYASRISLGKHEVYKFYPSSTADPLLRKPGVREGATLTILGSKAHLYGGVATDIFNEWETLNLSKESFLPSFV